MIKNFNVLSFKCALITFLIFLFFSFTVCFVKKISSFDVATIKFIQNLLSNIDNKIPIALGGFIFYVMTLIPLVIADIYFFINRMHKNIFFFSLVPFISYFISGIVKKIANRPRPPVELHLEEHMSSSSYVSRHTFITACLWGIFIYFVCKYCKNKFLKIFLISVSLFWIILEGFSRVWMGVHNPTDVVGGLILSFIFIILYLIWFRTLTTCRPHRQNAHFF